MRGKKHDWSRIDWTMRTSEIVRETGINQTTVSHARRRYAPETCGQAARAYDWGGVDWKKSTGAIARELDCDPHMVSTWRRRLAPQTLAPSVSMMRKRAAIKRIAELEEWEWGWE